MAAVASESAVEAPVTAPKLTPLCERLVSQLMLAQEKDHELLGLTRTLAQYSADKQTLLDKINLMQTQLERVDSVKQALAASFQASQQAYQRLLADDHEKRKETAAELQARIAQVNGYADGVTQKHAKVLHENASLKEQMSLLKQHRNTGDGKFQELSAAREKEVQGLKERLSKEKVREPILREALEKADELNQLVKAQHDEWKSKVDGFVAKFDGIQQRLVEAKHTFDTAKDVREKMARRLATLESERQQAITRAEKARAERDIEYAKATEVENTVGKLEAQIKKLTDLYAVLSATATS